MRDCGLTVAGFVYARDLDLVHAAGMKGIVYDARSAGYDQPYFVLIDPALAPLKDHPVIDELATRSQ